MCRDNRGHNYKELERRDAIKETVDDFIGEIIEIGIGKEDISYIFRYCFNPYSNGSSFFIRLIQN